MKLEDALKQMAEPDEPVTIGFLMPDDKHETISFANLKHALAQKALLYKWEYVINWDNHFIAK